METTTQIRKEINKLINKKYDEYLQFAKNIKGSSKEEPQDILNECILYLLENEDNKLEKIISYIDWYIIRMIKHSFHSNTSSYQVKYNRIVFDKNIDVTNITNKDADDNYNFDIDKQLEQIEMNMQKLTWYERAIFEKYTGEKTSWKKIEKETGIPASSANITYLKAIKKLRGN